MIPSDSNRGVPANVDDCVVTAGPLPSLALLRSIWGELELRSHCSFFLTWNWIGSWLQLIANRSDTLLIKVTRRSQIVALGVFAAKRAWGGAGPTHLRLHETGDRALDDLTIEYNGLLCEAGLEHAALTAVVRFLESSGRRWSTLDLAGLDAAAVPLQDLAASSNTLRVRRRPTHYVDLAKVRAQGDYLSTLGPQTRSAIRRTARKLVAQFGTLSTTVANDADTKLVYFRALIRLHEAHWRSKEGHAGAFSDARIVAFHEHLLATGAGSVQLLCLSAGEQVVGYAYNVVHRGIVYFYQAGVDYPHCAGYGSPGLLLLTQAVEHAIAMGHERFEFMAGSADYKRKLGAGQGELLWLSLDRPSVGSQLRNAARWLRARAGTAAR